MNRAEVVVIAGCPPAEELAEFLEGRLTGARRDAVVRHLADCDDCRAVYLGAAEFAQLEAEGSEAKPAPVVSIDSRRGRPTTTRFWSYAAAACLGVMLAGVVFRLSQPPSPVPSTGELLAAGERLESPPCFACSRSGLTRGSEGDLDGTTQSAFFAGLVWSEAFGAKLAEDSRIVKPSLDTLKAELGAAGLQAAADEVPQERAPRTAWEAFDEELRRAARANDLWELDLGRFVGAAHRAVDDDEFFAKYAILIATLQKLAGEGSELAAELGQLKASVPEKDRQASLQAILNLYRPELTPDLP